MTGDRAQRPSALRRLIAGCALAVTGIALAACSTGDRQRETTAALPTTSEAGLTVTAASPRPITPTTPVTTDRSTRAKPSGRSAFTDPRRVALAEASATCAFDWRQSLQQRIDATLPYATPRYRLRLQTVSDVDRSNWAGTQADHASGSCRGVSSAVIDGAPNTASTNYVRVQLVQTVSSPGHAPQSGSWLSTYRVLRQPDGRWLVDAELGGGG